MRLELAGSLEGQDGLIFAYSGDAEFVPQTYINMGYTNFDVIAIGASGGPGGGIDTSNTGTLARIFGGAGGGGGIQRVLGRLSSLPSTCDIVVGVAGEAGTTHASDPLLTTDGEDGGASSFAATIARASGGKGGKRAQANSLTSSAFVDGGEGGIGGSVVAGGGGLGGIAGVPTTTGPGTPGTAGEDGPWNGSIGSGGGGGAGGVGKYNPPGAGVTCVAGTKGGLGAYAATDLSAYVSGGVPGLDLSSNAANIIPGGGGGAKGSLITGYPWPYGTADPIEEGTEGVVLLKLTVV